MLVKETESEWSPSWAACREQGFRKRCKCHPRSIRERDWECDRVPAAAAAETTGTMGPSADQGWPRMGRQQLTGGDPSGRQVRRLEAPQGNY